MKKQKCEKCGRIVTICNYGKHIKACGNQKILKSIDENWKINDIDYKCPYCDKIYSKKGISTHIWRNHTESGKKHNANAGYIKGSRIIWNKGLTKETDERVKKIGETIIENYLSGKIIPSFKGRKHTKETKEKISKKLSKNNNGGKCKWFDYEKKDGKIVKLQGTWEVRFAKVLDILDENWIKIGCGNKGHSFIWNDGIRDHYYTPDFYSEKLNKYFEVKGYWWGNDKEKMNQVIPQNPHIKIEIIRKIDLEKYEKLIK